MRFINDDDINDINHMRIVKMHFAWDNPSDNLGDKFANFAKSYHKKSRLGIVYCLTNFEDVSVKDHIDRALYRIYTLRDLGFDPFVMIYNKPSAPPEIKRLQRWCNNKFVFKKCRDFNDYDTSVRSTKGV